MSKKKILVGLVLLPVLGLGLYGGYREYVSVRQIKVIKQAHAFLAAGNQKKALLCVERALRYDPNDVEACRIMAQLEEASHSPTALSWYNFVVKLAPHSFNDRLALTDAAIKAHEPLVASNALAGMDEGSKRTAQYQNAAGTFAASLNHFAEAGVFFAEAVRLDPQNPSLQLNLAVVRLRSTNAVVVSQARTSLTALSVNPTDPNVRDQALRELTLDALRQRHNENALALSGRLVQETNASFSDHLLRLEVLHETKDTSFQTALAAAQQRSVTNLGNVYDLALWEMTKTTPAEALRWMRTLPGEFQTNQAVAALIAECLISVSDWRGLQTFLDHQNWDNLDFIRHAFLAKAMRGEDLPTASQAQWGLALKAANNQKESLNMLLRLAAEWNWRGESEDLLWSIVNNYPDEKWAFQALSQSLFDNGRTRSLMQLYGQEAKRSPSDLVAKNNLAMTALLLDAKEIRPFELAREVYDQEPTNASYASTYAFALHVQKKDAEALAVLEKLKPEDLDKPGVSGYYGLILNASGNRAKAKKYLEMNLSAKTHVLPEEHNLFEAAITGA